MGVAAKLNYLKSLEYPHFFSKLLGILLALFFGQDQPDSATNWVNYHGGTGGRPSRVGDSDLAILFCLRRSISSLNTLCGVTNWRVLMGAVYGDRVHEVEQDWRIRTGFWLLASIPTCVRALVLSDFNVIAKYTGILQPELHGVSSSLV
jgi:hypothetical protein